MPFQPFLIALHDVGKWLLHVVLIPVVAGLKALISGLTYIHDEIAKV